jgi:hypothetical protein
VAGDGRRERGGVVEIGTKTYHVPGLSGTGDDPQGIHEQINPSSPRLGKDDN